MDTTLTPPSRNAATASRKRFARRGTLALVVAGGLGLLFFSMSFRGLTDSMLFYPERGQYRTPTALGLEFEEVWLDAAGARLQSWWVPGSQPSLQGPVVVMFHGNAGTIAGRLENVSDLIGRLGASVLQVEYPGYGDSEGTPSEESLMAAGTAGFREAQKRAAGRPIVLFGRSLGGAVAIDVAARHPVAGLVVESTFTNLPDLAETTGLPFARQFVSYQFDSLTKIADIETPTLLIHGDQDELVPYEMSHRLLAASGARDKTLHTVSGGRHNDTWAVGGEAYWLVWTEFITRLAQPKGMG